MITSLVVVSTLCGTGGVCSLLRVLFILEYNFFHRTACDVQWLIVYRYVTVVCYFLDTLPWRPMGSCHFHCSFFSCLPFIHIGPCDALFPCFRRFVRSDWFDLTDGIIMAKNQHRPTLPNAKGRVIHIWASHLQKGFFVFIYDSKNVQACHVPSRDLHTI